MIAQVNCTEGFWENASVSCVRNITKSSKYLEKEKDLWTHGLLTPRIQMAMWTYSDFHSVCCFPHIADSLQFYHPGSLQEQLVLVRLYWSERRALEKVASPWWEKTPLMCGFVDFLSCVEIRDSFKSHVSIPMCEAAWSLFCYILFIYTYKDSRQIHIDYRGLQEARYWDLNRIVQKSIFLHYGYHGIS